MKRILKLVRNKTVVNGSLFSLFSFFNGGVNFVLLIVIAKFLNPEGYGHINLFNTLITVMGFVVCLNANSVVTVNYFKRSRVEFEKTISSVWVITITMSLILLSIVLLIPDYIEKWTGLPIVFQIYALVISATGVFHKMALDIWRIMEKVKYYGILSCSYVLLNFILTFILVVGFNQDWIGRINSHLWVSLVFCGISLLILYRLGYLSKNMPDRNSIIDCLSFGVPLIPHSVSTWLRQGLDRIFINNYHNIGLVGLFSFAGNISNVITMLGTAFNATNSVYIFKNLSKDDEQVRQRLRKQTLLLIVFFVIITLLVCLGSIILIPVYFPKYDGGMPFVILQCLNAMFHCIYLQFVNVLFFFKKTKVLMYITFSVSIFHLLCSYFLTPISVYYTLWIGCISSAIITLLVYLYSRRIYKII